MLSKVHGVSNDDVDAVAALSDPTRRRVYDSVAAEHVGVGRDDVARELHIGRTLAAHHLEKLTESGLLEAYFERGPNGGRPMKLYRRSQLEKAVTVPPRSYVDAAELLAEAIERAGADLVLHKVAEEHGRHTPPGEMWTTLRARGYEPCEVGGLVKLRNCPFHRLAQEFAPLVCGMNLALLGGLAQTGAWRATPRMRPEKGYCCVVLEDR